MRCLALGLTASVTLVQRTAHRPPGAYL